MDDIHRSSILHPGPVIIPALLAAAGPGSSGPDLLSALVAGYEVMIRVGRALGPSHYRMWHSTATAGSFGAAAAASALLGLDAAQTAHALALAGTRAGGLWQVRHESQLGKAWHMAGAARDGLAAAQLAAAGLTGPLGVLDGPSGWFAATAPEADAGMIDAPRSSPWIDDVSFKPWPACRHAHPAIDALRELLGAQPASPQSILKVEVFTYADALRFCDKPNPMDEAQARFSIQHALAALLLWGEPQASHYSAETLKDPALSALRAIISVHSSAEFEDLYPAQYGARVVISWRDGRREESVLFDTLGDPARPMSQDAIQTKAATLMAAAGWSPQRIDAAISVCAALPTAATVDALNKVIQPCD
jgi:2-methylcitrate dehydratase PrpD